MITKGQYVALMRELLDRFEDSQETQVMPLFWRGRTAGFGSWDQRFHEYKQRLVNEMTIDEIEAIGPRED